MSRELIAQAEALEQLAKDFCAEDDVDLWMRECFKRAQEFRAQAAAQPAEPVASAPPADYDWMPEARGAAAQCWCDEETKHITLHPDLCEAVARRIAAWMQTGAFHARNEEYWRDRALKAETDPRIAELEGLLREASRALSMWHNFYGAWCNQPRMESALPPAGNVELQERIEAALGGLK